ncbi:uncharacterized protein METZ01_LOCUS367476, partial [marine metagenome]
MYFVLRSSSKKNLSPKAGFKSSSQIAFSSYFAKNGMPTHSDSLPCNSCSAITFCPLISDTPRTCTLPGV